MTEREILIQKSMIQNSQILHDLKKQILLERKEKQDLIKRVTGLEVENRKMAQKISKIEIDDWKFQFNKRIYESELK